MTMFADFSVYVKNVCQGVEPKVVACEMVIVWRAFIPSVLQRIKMYEAFRILQHSLKESVDETEIRPQRTLLNNVWPLTTVTQRSIFNFTNGPSVCQLWGGLPVNEIWLFHYQKFKLILNRNK